jgi:hypothetical protein
MFVHRWFIMANLILPNSGGGDGGGGLVAATAVAVAVVDNNWWQKWPATRASTVA